MAFLDQFLAVDLGSQSVRLDLAGVMPEAHGTAHLYANLVGHDVYQRVRTLGIELCRVRFVEADHVPGELDYRDLHSQAESEVRGTRLPRVTGRLYLPLRPAVAEPRQDQNAVRPAQALPAGIGTRQILGVYPVYVHLYAVCPAGVPQGLHDRKVRVLELHVLAHYGYLHRVLGREHPVHQRPPLGKVRGRRREPEFLKDEIVEALLMQGERDRVERWGILGGDHRLQLRVGEQRDLAPHVLVY